jgi:hypothetical protein
MGLFATLLLISFIFVVGIWNINGFRYYTAVQIFMYGTLKYFLEGKKSSLVIAVFSMFVHWSFGIALAILFAYMIIRNRTRVFFVLFVLSFFVSMLKMQIINEMFQAYAPAFLLESRSGYFNEQYAEHQAQSYGAANWYLRIYGEMLKWFIFASFAFIFIRGLNKLKANKQLYNLFNLSLLFYIVVNVLSIVPSVGRFYSVANMLSLALIFLNINMIPDNYSHWLKKAGLPALGIYIMVSIRFGLDFTGSSLLLGNPITSSFIENEMALIEFIKSLL